MKLSKLINSSARYQNSSNMIFLRAGRLYFNHDAFSCETVLLIILLIENKNKFYLHNLRIYLHRINFI